MKGIPILPALIERFFTERLIRQRNVSAHTIASYRDTFRLLLQFIQRHLKIEPSDLELSRVDAPLISAFLDDLEATRAVGARTRNLRLTAIRSFFRFAALEEPAHGAHIQRVLLVPSKLHDKRVVHFLTRTEIEAILAIPEAKTWLGRRDYALLLLAVQTGLRLSELTQLNIDSVILGRGAHVRCLGKRPQGKMYPTDSARRDGIARLAEGVPIRRRRGPIPHCPRRSFECRCRSTSTAEVCDGGSNQLRLLKAKASVRPCTAPHCSHGASSGWRALLDYCTLAWARVRGNHSDLLAFPYRTQGGCFVQDCPVKSASAR